jgi:hypothetical protein
MDHCSVESSDQKGENRHASYFSINGNFYIHLDTYLLDLTVVIYYPFSEVRFSFSVRMNSLLN